MSRWLKSVNNLLDNLDGKAEDVVADAEQLLEKGQQAVALGFPLGNQDEDDESYETEEDYYDEDEDEDEDEEEEEDFFTSDPQPRDNEDQQIPFPRRRSMETVSDISISERSEFKEVIMNTTESQAPQSGLTDTTPSPPNRLDSFKSQITDELESVAADTTSNNVHPKKASSVENSTDPPKIPQRKSSLPKTAVDKTDVKFMQKIQSLQEALSKTRQELKTSQAETQNLQRQNKTLDTQLLAANTEIDAQSKELQRAAERLEKDRQTFMEEKEELLDEQDEEIEQLKAQHEEEMQNMKQLNQQKVATLTKKLEGEQSLRMHEGGVLDDQLQDVIEREKIALTKLQESELEASKTKDALQQLQSDHSMLQEQLTTALETIKTASERERMAQDKLDSAVSMHTRQMNQRQTREAELEKSVLELGAALTAVQQEQQKQQQELQRPSILANKDEDTFKDKYNEVVEQMETLQVQLNYETQRREALQQELYEVSKERSQEVSVSQKRQQSHDAKVADLEATIAKLRASAQDTMASNNKLQSAAMSQELEEAKREVSRLSDQLLRHQRVAETSKSEILALKGRLQTATARATEAERSLVASQSTTMDVESGGYRPRSTTRRRIKGAGTRTRPSQSLRFALNMGPVGRGNHAMEQVATTIDALDKWMMDTGTFMRHEPMARLGFYLYLVTLHLWSFALVAFHTIEEPHADFGTLDNNPRHWRAH